MVSRAIQEDYKASFRTKMIGERGAKTRLSSSMKDEELRVEKPAVAS